MKLTSHTTTTSAIEAAIITRLGARPAEVSTYTDSGQPFFAHGELLDAIHPRRKADPRPGWHANGSLRRYRYFWLDNVLMPITPAGGHIPGQNKIRQSRQRNVVRAPDPRLQHPATPHRDALGLAKIVNPLRHGVSAHSPHFDVDDLASAQCDSRLRLLRRMDALIQANRRLQSLLQLDMTVQIIPAQRLLDHHQVISVQLLEQRPIRSAIRRIRVHHQLDGREILPEPLYLLHIFARLDLDLDALVTGSQFFL